MTFANQFKYPNVTFRRLEPSRNSQSGNILGRRIQSCTRSLLAFDQLEDRRLLSSTTFQDGLNGYDGTRDTKIKGLEPAINFGSSSSLELDGSPDEALLLKWDLSSIAPGSLIQSVSLSLNSLSTTSAGYEIYDLTKNRIEDETTWNEFSTGSSWNQGGASGSQDHGTTVLGTFTAASPGPVASDLNAAGVAVVQSWGNNPSGNYGIIVQDYDPANGVRFSSADASSSADRPALMVSYAEPQYSSQSRAAIATRQCAAGWV